MRKQTLTVALALALAGCASGVKKNASYESELISHLCSPDFFTLNESRIKRNSDVIYTGINAGLVARNCDQFEKSNEFFDAAEEAYKEDVDLQGVLGKGSRLLVGNLVNETVLDYQGTLYERIMLNSYKGLNYMSLGDFENARVEFNRALARQDKAKEYFASEIAKNRKELEKETEKADAENIKTLNNEITASYDSLFKEFSTTKEFVNPYVTWLASVFFYMDNDYIKASDLFREVAIIYPKDKNLQAQRRLFDQRAKQVRQRDNKKYIFVAYEDGFGTEKAEFKLTLPLIIEGRIITSSFALPTLKKRAASYGDISVNNVKASEITDFDTVIATEFKTTLPGEIAKSIASTITKTAANVLVAKHDSTGGLLALASSVATTLMTQADVRSWQGLPKTASVVMVENTGKIEIRSIEGTTLVTREVDASKNVLVVVRSFAPQFTTNIDIIER